MNRIVVLIPLVNMVGAVAIYFYFSFIMPSHEIAAEIPGYFSPLFAVIGTAVLCLSGVRLALLHFFCSFFDKNTIKQA